MKIKLLVFLIALLSIIKNGIGQTITVDSLYRINQRYQKIDAIKEGIYCRISSSLRYSQPLLALKYADSMIYVAKRLDDHNILAEALSQRANILLQMGKIEESQKVLDTILIFLNNKKDKNAIMNSEAILFQKGICYETNSYYDKALEMYNKCLTLANKINDTSMIFNNKFRSIYISVYTMDFENALTKSFELKTKWENFYSKSNNKSILFYANFSSILNLLGTIQMYMKNYDESLKNLTLSVKICDSVKGIAASQKNTLHLPLAELLVTMKYYKESYLQIQFANSFLKKSNQTESLGRLYLILGRIFRDAPDDLLKNFNVQKAYRLDTALSLMMEAKNVAENLHSISLKKSALEEIAILFEKKKDFPMAFKYFKDFKTFSDSITDVSMQKRILINNMSDLYQRQTDSMKFVNELEQSKLQKVILSRQQETFLAIKEKEIQRLAFLKTQADLQNTSLLEQQNQKELELTKKEKNLQIVKVNKLAKDMEITTFELKQQKLNWIAGIGLLTLLSFFIMYNSRLRRKRMAAVYEKDKANQLLKEAELKNKMNDITMSALQSQMNPHFIFNVLNSINKYILTSDATKASEYLVSFSKLIRLVLESSKSTKVTLQSDLDALQLYINMEKMRFEDKFESTIEVDKNIDAQFIMIPPLLIQPYVENAIWHGLLQKDGDNKLMIHVSQPESNELLITITDDGIGRKKAAELKSKSASQKKSFGMQITKDRIGIVNQLTDQKTSVDIEDLYDESGNATGTKVSLRLLV